MGGSRSLAAFCTGRPYDSFQATELSFAAFAPRNHHLQLSPKGPAGAPSREGCEYPLARTAPLLDHELPREFVRTISSSSSNVCALNHL